MDFNKGNIEGIVIKKLVKYVDERGYLIETFRINEIRHEETNNIFNTDFIR